MVLEKIIEKQTIESGALTIKFEIDTRTRHTDSPHNPQNKKNRLKVNAEKDGRKGFTVIDPSKFAVEPFMPEHRLIRIGVVQVIPYRSTPNKESYAILMGTDNQCCHGALLYLTLDVYDTGKDIDVHENLRNGVTLPFNIGGVLGNHSKDRDTYAIVYGSGCDGSGIRIVNLETATASVKEVVSSEDARKYGTSYQFFKKPFVKEGSLFIPSARNMTNHKMIDELDIERKIVEAQGEDAAESLLAHIKEAVAKSIFIYGPGPGR